MKAAIHVQLAAIPPSEIDEVVLTGRRLRKLNYLEAVYFARVIDKLYARKVTVDASDVIPERFRNDIEGNLVSGCKIVAVHKADRDNHVVSAASIVAKVVRDREVEILRELDGEFGSGYPSDPVTRSFFADWMKRGVPFPTYVRQSWKTFGRIEQTLLEQF
jgi:ribonuclease HII